MRNLRDLIVLTAISFGVAYLVAKSDVVEVRTEVATATSESGLKLIKAFEGLRLKAYKDPVGIWTIGFGHTATAVEGMVITLEEANELLRKDLEKFESAVQRLVTVELNQNQFDALVSFTYNVGEGALSRSTLLVKLNGGDFKGAAMEFDRWTWAKGIKFKGLELRRKAEKALFLS